MPTGRPRINAVAPLTSSERQARHRERVRDAVGRLDAARQVVERSDKAARLCGDMEVVAAWIELCCILNGDKSD